VIGKALMAEMRKQRVDLHMGFEVAGLAKNAAGIDLSATNGARLRGYDCVIWAVGRAPNARGLELAAAGFWRDVA
jgi:glutathione reductase (NADPH)